MNGADGWQADARQLTSCRLRATIRPLEATAVVAALERFMRKTAPPSAQPVGVSGVY
jgi:hypothetical protein